MKKLSLSFIIAFMLLCSGANAQMFWQQAAIFNGNSRIAVSPNSALDLAASFTLEAWIKPSSSQTSGIIGKQNADYDLRMSGTKIALRTKGVTRLITKLSTVIPTTRWTHVAATFNASINQFKIYINSTLDTTISIINARPIGTSDSIYVGSGFNGAFNGMIDEARIWNRELSISEIQANRLISIATAGNTGNAYNGLLLSLTMQNASSISPFTVNDFSNNNNTVFNRGVTALNLTGKPSSTNNINQCINLDGTDSYLAGASVPALQFTNAITVQAWVYPKTLTGTKIILSKGSASDYGLRLSGPVLAARINGTQINSTDTILINRWTHTAFSYEASTGNYKFYINGILKTTGNSSLGNISVPADSIFIGKSSTGQFFDGYIDEVRLSGMALPDSIISFGLHRSYDAGNEPLETAGNIVYNLDGYTIDNCENGGPKLLFRNSALFSTDFISPINRFDLSLPAGFLLKESNRLIPQFNTSGLMLPDSITISGMPNIQDLNLFIALNHTFISDLNVILTAPNGDSAIVTFRHGGSSNGMISVFDDQADSSAENVLSSTGGLVSFYTTLKPIQSFNNIFSGINPNGVWQLKIQDILTADAGRLYTWGLQINNIVNVGVTQISTNIPNNFALEQNYPNPFNPSTTIKFDIPKEGFVTLRVYDIAGREVAKPVDGNLTPGQYKTNFDGSSLSSGVYFYKFISGNFIETKKMLLVK